MAQYSIPQFIEDEGRIISFLTFRQFFTLVGGGATIFFLYFIGLPILLVSFLALIIMLLAVLIAFIKIDGVPITKVFLSFFGFFLGAKTYTWKKGEILDRSMMGEAIQAKAPSKLLEMKKKIETMK